ncbi:hypothetical protein JWG44_19805 [Leptospira sp. 201903071]|uniref:hypothetical protein n=1 Tax=Leptospira ainazelensis TaxID=2810034 RepID=UPI001964978B|nr:hypothetical protein [Leptospira ainazelensis]MBM9502502.1 hypothetical protein [Leptospira ainazelensis]
MQNISLGKGKSPDRFLIFILFLFLSFANRSETKSTEHSPESLNPFFFSARPDSSFALGILAEAKKENLPSYGLKLSVPILKENPRHLWKGNLLYQNERIPERENRSFHRTFSGLEYSYLPHENRFSLSWFAGWERGEIDLFVFGTRLEISEKQGIQIFGKRGGNFENVSILLHSPLKKELGLFLGASRTWSGTIVEDRFFLGIGFSWDSFQASVSGIREEENEHSFSGIFEFQNIPGSTAVSKKPDLSPKKFLPRKKYAPFVRFSFSVQELLSAGFSLDSSLRISGKSSGSREEFFEWIDSLSEKEKIKILVLLRKKNPSLKKEKF